MEYVPGGDFRTLLNNSGVLKEEHARFYISEMFAAVNELHKLGYIHRDLKPEVISDFVLFAPYSKHHVEFPGRRDRSRQIDRLWPRNRRSQSKTHRIS